MDNSLDSYQIEGKYRLSFSKIFSMEFGYSYNNSKRENTRNVVDFDETTGSYSDFNQALSSDFKFSNIQNTPSLSFRTRTDKLNINLTARYTNTNLANSDFLQNSFFSKSYNNLLVNSWFGYTLGNNKRFGISLSTGLSVPQINELQPVPNVSNPLNITIGNPDLRPSINRRIYLNYNNYNWREKTGFFVYMGLSYINDRVSPTTITDENFIRTTRYVNVNGNYNHYGGIGYSKELKKDSTLTVRFNFKPSFNVQKNVGFNNGDRLETKRFTITPRISTLFNYKELVTIEPEYFISLNSTKYNLDNLSDISFTSHNLTLKTTSYWPKNLILGNDIGYNYNGNVSGDFDRDAIFWNMSIGLQMMKKKATLKVLGYDILNQNINTRRTTGEDFIQDFQGTVLQRYFMTSFTYKFDQFGGKKTKPSRFGF